MCTDACKCVTCMNTTQSVERQQLLALSGTSKVPLNDDDHGDSDDTHQTLSVNRGLPIIAWLNSSLS